MPKQFNFKKVQNYRSYKVRDICKIFKDKNLHEDTIRNWINSGELEAFKYGNTYYIYGGVLKEFLRKKRNLSRRKLSFKEFKCWKCKNVDEPKDGVINYLSCGTNNNIVAYSTCTECGLDMQRTYSISSLKEITSTFKIIKNNVLGLYDTTPSINNAHMEKNINDIPLSKKNISTTPSSNLTKLNSEKTTPSIKKDVSKNKQFNMFDNEW